jgi:hypothetical protein
MSGLSAAPTPAQKSAIKSIESRGALNHWLPQLSKAESAVLQAVYNAYPNSMGKEEIADATGYQATGGGFNNAIYKLRSLELIEGKGELKASDVFFQ